MKSLLGLCILSLFGLPVGARAKDAEYNSTLPFRPSNVTQATQMKGVYHWVGSYYNATTEIELTPTIGHTPDRPVCDNLRNTTIAIQRDSVLAITERGPYNLGSNPVNLWLNMIRPNYSWSDLPWWKEAYLDSNVIWPLLSSEPFATNRSSISHLPPVYTAEDYFNITASKPRSAAFALSGTVHSTYGSGWGPTNGMGNISMTACDGSRENGDWQLSLEVAPWWNTENWTDYAYPTINASFDDHTANLTIHGKFAALPYLHGNISTLNSPMLSGRNAVLGDIRIRFHGVLDTYHSDILDVNSSSPAWLRTVGFGNNSLNIGNNIQNGGMRSGVGLSNTSITVLFILFGMILSA